MEEIEQVSEEELSAYQENRDQEEIPDLSMVIGPKIEKKAGKIVEEKTGFTPRNNDTPVVLSEATREELEKELKRQHKQLCRMQEVLENKDKTIDELQENLSQLLDEKARIKHQALQEQQQQIERIQALTKEVSDYKEKEASQAIGNQKERVEELELEVRELMEENQVLMSQQKEVETKYEEMMALEMKLSQLEKNVKQMTLEKEQLVEETMLLQQAAVEREEQKTKLNESLEKAKETISELEKAVAQKEIELTEVQEQLDQLQVQIQQHPEKEELKAKLKEVIESTQQEYVKWEEERRTLDNTLKQAQENYETLLAEKDCELKELKEKLSLPDTINAQTVETNGVDEIKNLEDKIEKLEKEKVELQKENEELQTEIGEVLVFARRKANRTMEEAKIESERMLKAAEMKIESIHDRAKEILFDVDETKESVVDLFEDLQAKIQQLSEKKLLFESFE